MALGSEIGTKAQAWEWICEQITASALHPQWIHRPLTDRLGILFADFFRKIGDCRLPISIGPAVASQLFARWNAISDLRIEKNGWTLASDDSALKEHSGIVSRNVNRARVRLALEKYRGAMGSDSAPRDPAGNVINDPSDDEPPPVIPDDVLLAQTSFPVLDPKWNNVPNPSTPKRTAQDPSSDAPDPKAQRVNSPSVSTEDKEFSSRRATYHPASYFVRVATEQVLLAGREPARGWPSYSALCPSGNPTDVIHDPVFNTKNFWNKPAHEGVKKPT